MTLDVGLGTVTATAYHPFWVVRGDDLEGRPPAGDVALTEDRGGVLAGRWVNSHEVRVGDAVYVRGHGPVMVVRVTQRRAQTPVCNLTVLGLHTFAVGEAQLLVHNTSASQRVLLDRRDELLGALERFGPDHAAARGWREEIRVLDEALRAAPLANPLSQSGALRNAAVEVHNLAATATSRIGVNQSTVSIVEATLLNGTRQLFASGSGARLTPAQVNRLVELGVPRENIFSGAASRLTGATAEETRLLNHAERVILRNLPEGATVNRWGISWGGQQRAIPCDVCEPFVNQAGGVVEGR